MLDQQLEVFMVVTITFGQVLFWFHHLSVHHSDVLE